MKNHSLPKVTFYRVKNNSAKIHLIGLKAQEAFKKEKRLLITVPNFQSAEYIETLLWQIPTDSFMPHVVADTPTVEWIAITMQDQQNINQANSLFNLCSTSPTLYQQVVEVYELLDETQSQKEELSQQRIHFYQSKGICVKIENF